MSETTELAHLQNLSASAAESEGDRLFSESKQKEALEFYLHALDLFLEKEEKKDAAGIFLKIGNLYNSIHDTENTLANYMEGRNLSNEISDDKSVLIFDNKIGAFYQELYQFSNAHEYFTGALKIAEKLNDTALIQECHYNLGNCLNWMERLEDAFLELKKALSIKRENDNLVKKIVGSMGILLYKMKDYQKSLTYLNEALEINDRTGGSTLFRAGILKSIGYVYFLTGNIKEALRCLDETTNIAKDLPPNILAVVEENYSIIYEETGEYKKALEHLKKKNLLEDILVNENVKLKTRELQKKFDIAETQKEKEIFRLKNIDLANANDEISRQKIELEEKNRSITDSIFYAGTLQKAVLPPENLLNKYLPESFIYFQPKDIVSGDFYWFSGQNEQFVISAVDCTGHGVPGALMSMMGNNFLSTIVDSEGKTNPAEILQQMNKRTKTLLQNKDSNVTANDGMDIALCSIDFKTNTLYFSGAYRPLIFTRNGELNELKADKQSIGGISDYDTSYRLNEIKFQKGDTFYIYSDGYADQFGGTKNRKFMAGKFKSLLHEISVQPMNKQQQLLADNHSAWRGSNEQVDDILVIGFRL